MKKKVVIIISIIVFVGLAVYFLFGNSHVTNKKIQLKNGCEIELNFDEKLTYMDPEVLKSLEIKNITTDLVYSYWSSDYILKLFCVRDSSDNQFWLINDRFSGILKSEKNSFIYIGFHPELGALDTLVHLELDYDKLELIKDEMR